MSLTLSRIPARGRVGILRWLVPLLLLLPGLADAHNGEDHGGAGTPPPAPGATHFTTSVSSDNFELVLRYAPLRAGAPATLRLFVSDFVTNVPLHGAKLTLMTTEAPTIRLQATETAPGDYRLTGQFPANRAYALAVQVVAADGRADLLLLKSVEVGKQLPALADSASPAATPWLTWRTALVALGGLLLGAALTAWLLRRRRQPSPIAPSSVSP